MLKTWKVVYLQYKKKSKPKMIKKKNMQRERYMNWKHKTVVCLVKWARILCVYCGQFCLQKKLVRVIGQRTMVLRTDLLSIHIHFVIVVVFIVIMALMIIDLSNSANHWVFIELDYLI